MRNLPEFYILDRNAVSRLKCIYDLKYINNGEKTEKEKGKIIKNAKLVAKKDIDKLKSIDKSNNRITCFFSSLEGNLKRRYNSNEISEAVSNYKKETNIISDFYSNAVIEENYHPDLYLFFEDIIRNLDIETDLYNAEKNFLDNVGDIIYHKFTNEDFSSNAKISFEERIILMGDVIKLAKSYSLNIRSITVMICIGIIFDCVESRKILKLNDKKFNAYNALSDLKILKQLAQIKYLMDEKYKARYKVKLITFDNKLDCLMKKLKIEVEEEKEIDSLRKIIIYRPIPISNVFFPKLDKKQLKQVKKIFAKF